MYYHYNVEQCACVSLLSEIIIIIKSTFSSHLISTLSKTDRQTNKQKMIIKNKSNKQLTLHNKIKYYSFFFLLFDSI